MADQQNETGLLPGEKAPIIVAPVHAAPKSPAEAAKGQSTVTMEFPKSVHLTTAPGHSIFYPAGVHEVPDHLSDHWYLKANGARPYSRIVQVPGSDAASGETSASAASKRKKKQ